MLEEESAHRTPNHISKNNNPKSSQMLVFIYLNLTTAEVIARLYDDSKISYSYFSSFYTRINKIHLTQQ